MNAALVFAAGFFVVLAGCQSSSNSEAPAKAHNAYTESIDRSVGALNKAQANVEKANAASQAREKEIQSGQ